jgi:ferric-dicitrate binding protein FerR (iron transport regulator)
MSTERDPGDNSEGALQELFAHAKPRLEPPAHETEEVRRAVYAEWDAVTGPRVWRRRAGFAAAASVLLATAIWVGGALNPAAPPIVARVERLQGSVEMNTATPPAIGATLPAGTRVSTGMGQVALRLASGGSLRLASGSSLVLTSTDAAELSAGVVYFDSESRRAGAAFAITTEIGTVRDVGTQFLVRLDGGQSRLDVGVREGRVVLMTNAESGTADVGERLIAVEGAAAIRREPIATFGNEWEWAEALAPPFDTNGRSISDFLDWFAAQTGRTIEFADVAAERLAQERITGSIGVEEPAQKLSLVLATTDLKATLEDDGRVVISLR